MRIVFNKRIKNISVYGLILFYFLLPFEYPLASLGTESLLKYVGVLTMGLALIDVASNQQFKIKKDYRSALMVIWILYAGLTVIWCISNSAFATYYPMYARNALMFVFIAVVEYTEKESKVIRNAFVLGIGMLLFYMTFIPEAVQYSAFQSRLELVAGSSHLDENYLAALMLVPYGFVVYGLVSQPESRIKKIIRAIYCFGCIFYIFATGSRSGLIAVCMITFFTLAQNSKKRALYIAFIVTILVCAMLYIIPLLPDNLLQRYSLAAMTGNTSESNDRIQIWEIALNSLKDKGLLFGYGTGAAETIIQASFERKAAVHNFYIAHVLELGLFGFSLFMTIVVKMGKELFQNRRYAILFGYLGILIMGLFLDMLTTKFFWSTMMMTSVYVSAGRFDSKFKRYDFNGRCNY